MATRTPGSSKPRAAGAKASKRPPAKSRPASKAQPPRRGKTDEGKPLPAKVQRFIDEYLIDFNGSAAYKRAGYAATGNSAEVNARRLLRNAQVSLEIARRQAKSAEKLEISREEALQEAWNIVKADANELIEYRRFSCVECFNDGKPERRAPNPGCTACHGEGKPDVLVKDTRNLSPQAKALYAGVKITKDGLEVKMHSKLDALEKVFKHLGLYAADKPAPPNVHVGVSVGGALHEMTDDELTRIAAGGSNGSPAKAPGRK
jgi:phage terminase small subunit